MKVIRDIEASTHGTGRLEPILLDLSSFSSIRSAAESIKAKTSTLNSLICNAGIMMCPEGRTADGHELQLGTNHYGHFLLFHLLKDLLLSSATPSFSSRVITVSSASHLISPIRWHDMDFSKEGYNRIKAYGQSKTANIYMANSIERHYCSQNLHAFSVHPGVILDTELIRHQTGESLDQDFGMERMRPILKSIPQGAATQVWAAVARELEEKGRSVSG